MTITIVKKHFGRVSFKELIDQFKLETNPVTKSVLKDCIKDRQSRNDFN